MTSILFVPGLASGFLDFRVDLKNPDFTALAQAVELLGLKTETAKRCGRRLSKHSSTMDQRWSSAGSLTGAVDDADNYVRAGSRLWNIHGQGYPERTLAMK